MFQSQKEFERIMMPHTRRLLRFALRLTSNTPAAEDLVQETLLQAWRAFHQFKRDTNSGAWLFRILMNTFHGQHRKMQMVEASSTLWGYSPASCQASTLGRLEVNQALQALSGEQRTVLILAVVEGFTSREIAEILSIPIGTVMSRVSRARLALRDRLAPKLAAVAQGGNNIS